MVAVQEGLASCRAHKFDKQASGTCRAGVRVLLACTWCSVLAVKVSCHGCIACESHPQGRQYSLRIYHFATFLPHCNCFNLLSMMDHATTAQLRSEAADDHRDVSFIGACSTACPCMQIEQDRKQPQSTQCKSRNIMRLQASALSSTPGWQ